MERLGDSLLGAWQSFPYVLRKADTVINLTGSTVTEEMCSWLAYTDIQIRLIRTGKAHPNVAAPASCLSTS